ncbi:hypothetical protein P3T76_015214 [Phytophthora citrophthora]|uniref:Peroxisomal membrane protein PEX14 n=1 Tax=Phytophthora citrophthora TaxID=4793 RepID=A0AAD9G0H8_9STRA|nr:hypothetical protein P3T76_015214 [Phytophthora citrophthora]
MDLSLLHKCEEFLLHPTVRALSLAQRVDFLEKKGLSPEEITQCLKSVERRNGLSQLAKRTAEELVRSDATASESISTISKSPVKLLQFIVKKYGLVTLLLALLGFGYAQFRRRKTQQLLLQHENHKTQHRRRMHSRVEALLAVVKDQQTQYNQAAELLNVRVTKYLAEQQGTKTNVSGDQLSRGSELQSLQSELLELKSAVIDSYLQPKVVNKVVEVVKEIPIVLRPAEAKVTERLTGVVQGDTNSSKSEKIVCVFQKGTKKTKPAMENHSGIRDQTTLSSEEITELFERSQVEEEMSTAGSYRVLFATQ